MDDVLLRKINRQLRAIKFVMVLLLLSVLAMGGVLGFIAYQSVAFTQVVDQRLSGLQYTTGKNLNVQSQLCSDNSLKQLLPSGVC